MNQPSTMDRRRFLRNAAGISAGLVAAPTVLVTLTNPRAARAATATAADPMLPFVGHYQTNLTTNLTPATNAAVDILSSMARLWQTGTAWNNGVVLAPEVLRANMLYCVRITTTRTEAAAKESFIIDRQDNSYAMIDGLGPLAALYKTGALAVTSITTAPDGTPPTTVSDGVPPGAPAGSATGAGSTTSALGDVALLVNTLRGSYSSSNPSKYAYQYPRPWRMTDDSTVIDTGTVDGYGFPVYKSDVIVAPQLLRQRSLTPATDGGFPSGHTNAFFLAGLALAYAIPERFQELVTRAYENANYRIIAGMHSPTDVVGGRILGTALAAAILNDPANATIKANARSQALAYFEAQSGNTAGTRYAYAHSAGPDTDPYASREVNARTIAPYFTYILPRRGPDTAMTVPQGAEVLLETRQPYLSADQRREVLRTTALPAGYDLLDGPEQWGRLNLFAAADGYGEFDSDVQVTMDAANGGFRAADAWRNDIGGPGGLTKLGAGQLTLTGVNRYRGGTQIQAGTLVAASPNALGLGDVRVSGGATLQLPLHGDRRPALEVDGTVTLAPDSVLAIQLDSPAPGEIRPVISAQRIHGKFGTITVSPAGYQAEPLYSTTGLSVRITR